MGEPKIRRVGGAGASETGAAGGGARVGLVLSGGRRAGALPGGSVGRVAPNARGRRTPACRAAQHQLGRDYRGAVRPVRRLGGRRRWLERGGHVGGIRSRVSKPAAESQARRIVGSAVDSQAGGMGARPSRRWRGVGPVDAVLDTTPLWNRARQAFKADRVAANVERGLVQSLAVASTALSTCSV